jgi:hypothetical protein
VSVSEGQDIAAGSSSLPSPLAQIPPAALQTLDQKHAGDHGENNFKDQPTNAHVLSSPALQRALSANARNA